VTLPAHYVAQVERSVALIRQWFEQWPGPGLPDLRFRDSGKTMVIGNLDDRGRRYLGLSPDAVRLLEFIDSETAHQLTIFQASCALRLAGFLPP